MIRLMAVVAGLLLWTGCDSSVGSRSSTGSLKGGVDDTARSSGPSPGGIGGVGTVAADGGVGAGSPERSMSGVAAKRLGATIPADGGTP